MEKTARQADEAESIALLSQEGVALAQVQARAENWTAEQILQWSFETYGRDVAVATAFGAEGIALIDIAAQVWPQPRIFLLDTSFLFPETYRLIDQVEQRYGLSIERILPSLTPEAQAELCGPELWKRDPDLCCLIRKVEPLQRKLAELRAWITSIRREQTPSRAQAKKIEWDSQFSLLKINPLADWTHEMVWQYIRERQLPYNPLHDLHHPSIGCTHCTRAVEPGENPRAGRWPGFNKQECGLHAANLQSHPSRSRD
jgi:phosphoadenosine phosphosulfate reductase